MSIDLVPFGFTPTENLAYAALLELGPSSGYAVAKHLSIARANAYQALNGLVSKGGAALIGDQPQRFRAVQPRALLVLITAREDRKLDALERQVATTAGDGTPTLVPLEGERAIIDVAMRTIVRAPGPVRCLAPASLLQALLPAWRKREADGLETGLWSLGAADAELPVTVRGSVRPGDPALSLSPDTVLLDGAGAGLCALLANPPTGYWTSEPLLLQVISLALDRLTL